MSKTNVIALTINGEKKSLSVQRGETLFDALRNASYFSVKNGCKTGDCGACTVLLDGQPVYSCTLPAAKAEGREVLTVEGLASGGQLHPLQQAFIDAGGSQCGYCTPGQLMAAKALLDRNPNPTEAEIREAMSGVLCRCTGYVKIVQAVQRAAAMLRGERVDAGQAGPCHPERPMSRLRRRSGSTMSRPRTRSLFPPW